MSDTRSTVAVLGAGSWGLTLANLLDSNGHSVRVWEFDPEVAQRLRDTRELPQKLPGIAIASDIEITSDPATALRDVDACLFVVPSVHLRSVAERVSATPIPGTALVLSLTKGLEAGTNRRMTEIIAAELGRSNGERIVAVSGPSHAEEVARGVPTAVVAASRDPVSSQDACTLLNASSFRVYMSDDPVGVELGGALKNVVAIAAGIVDGLDYSSTDNVKSALMTRGLAEITRVALRLGAKAETFAGLSGVGDLIATCTSRHSRNRHVGERIGRGERLNDILNDMPMVAEGVPAAHAAMELVRKHDVDMPIAAEIHRVLFENKSPAAAVADLMARPPKTEVWT